MSAGIGPGMPFTVATAGQMQSCVEGAAGGQMVRMCRLPVANADAGRAANRDAGRAASGSEARRRDHRAAYADGDRKWQPQVMATPCHTAPPQPQPWPARPWRGAEEIQRCYGRRGAPCCYPMSRPKDYDRTVIRRSWVLRLLAAWLPAAAAFSTGGSATFKAQVGNLDFQTPTSFIMTGMSEARRIARAVASLPHSATPRHFTPRRVSTRRARNRSQPAERAPRPRAPALRGPSPISPRRGRPPTATADASAPTSSKQAACAGRKV